MRYAVSQHPRKAHQWIVNGKTVCGPKDEDGAIALFKECHEGPRPVLPPPPVPVDTPPGQPVAPVIVQAPAPVKEPEPVKELTLKEKVDAERDRRIALGQTVTLSDGRTIKVQTKTEDDFMALDRLQNKALAYSLMQKPDVKMSLRDADNQMHELTASQMIELRELVDWEVQAIYEASWQLKDLSPIPENFADEKFWP